MCPVPCQEAFSEIPNTRCTIRVPISPFGSGSLPPKPWLSRRDPSIRPNRQPIDFIGRLLPLHHTGMGLPVEMDKHAIRVTRTTAFVLIVRIAIGHRIVDDAMPSSPRGLPS